MPLLIGRSVVAAAITVGFFFVVHFTHTFVRTHKYSANGYFESNSINKQESGRESERGREQQRRWQRMAKIKCKTHAHVRLLLLFLLLLLWLCFQLRFYSFYLVYTRIRVRNRMNSRVPNVLTVFAGKLLLIASEADGATSRGAQVSLQPC